MRNMKKIFLLISAILLIVPVQAQHTLRLMTYNIKNATGMDGVCDFQRIANVINNASPDVVAVQEVDSVTNRSNQKYVLGEIAERTQMYACFAPAIDYDGGKYGIGLLSKKAPVHLQTIALPGREEARALILADLKRRITTAFSSPSIRWTRSVSKVWQQNSGKRAMQKSRLTNT